MKKGIRKKLHEIWREFWHIEIINGKEKFKFSSKKFHFQISQFNLYLAIYFKIFGPEKISERITVEILIALGSHALATGTWYAWRKHADIEAQEKKNNHEKEDHNPEEDIFESGI